jgi:nitroreductase
VNEVNLNRGGPPEIVLPNESRRVLDGIETAISLQNTDDSVDQLLNLAELNPDSIAIWTQLGVLSSEKMQAYAFFRLAYHRGLDALRKNGWRGSGFVRWSSISNRYFLRALHGLEKLSEEIDDSEEAARCHLFLLQLEPLWESVSPDYGSELNYIPASGE